MKNKSGEIINYHFYDTTDARKAEIVQELIADAEKALGPGKLYEIRERLYPNMVKYINGYYVDDYGHRKRTRLEVASEHGAAWYYSPNLEKGVLFLHKLGDGEEPGRLAGFVLTGRLITHE